MQYRFKALARTREPDELDAPTVLAAPRGWVAVLVILAVTAAAIVWAALGRIPQTVGADGLLIGPGGDVQVQSLYPGIVASVPAELGGYVSQGRTLATIQDSSGRKHDVTSPVTGQVVSVAANIGQVIGVGDPVATLERGTPGGDSLVGYLFVSSGSAYGIRPGESVALSVSSAPPAAFGLLRGRVSAISPYPLTSEELSALLGGPLAAQPFENGGSPWLVTVRLIPDPATASGYAWTTATGPPARLSSQVPVSGLVTLGDLAPLTLLFGR